MIWAFFHLSHCMFKHRRLDLSLIDRVKIWKLVQLKSDWIIYSLRRRYILQFWKYYFFLPCYRGLSKLICGTVIAKLIFQGNAYPANVQPLVRSLMDSSANPLSNDPHLNLTKNFKFVFFCFVFVCLCLFCNVWSPERVLTFHTCDVTFIHWILSSNYAIKWRDHQRHRQHCHPRDCAMALVILANITLHDEDLRYLSKFEITQMNLKSLTSCWYDRSTLYINISLLFILPLKNTLINSPPVKSMCYLEIFRNVWS